MELSKLRIFSSNKYATINENMLRSDHAHECTYATVCTHSYAATFMLTAELLCTNLRF